MINRLCKNSSIAWKKHNNKFAKVYKSERLKNEHNFQIYPIKKRVLNLRTTR